MAGDRPTTLSRVGGGASNLVYLPPCGSRRFARGLAPTFLPSASSRVLGSAVFALKFIGYLCVQSMRLGQWLFLDLQIGQTLYM